MTAPLQSGTDCSSSGFNQRLAADRAQIERDVTGAGQVHVGGDGTAMLIASAYPPFEGVLDNGPLLRIALATGPSSPIVQHIDGARLEGTWRPGSLVISPPQGRGLAKTARTSIVGLALLPPKHGSQVELDLEHLTTLAAAFQDDPLLVSVITALHHEAAIHGVSTAFFDEGRALILRRLSELRGTVPKRRKAHPLSDPRYQRVLAYVEDHLAYNLPIAQLAQIAGMDASSFTRAMRARTGLAPYAWLTQLRMERASALLRSGLPVTQVAAMLGYANPGKFSSAYKRVTGYLPSRWMRAEEG